MKGRSPMGLKGAVIIATCFVLGWGVFLLSRRVDRSITLNLDDGVMACGFRGDPAILPSSAEDLVLRARYLTLQARGRVVFSGRVDGVECYRSAESRWGLPGGDFIQVALSDAQLEPTVTRWVRIYQQLGASPRDLKSLDSWAKEVIDTERAGRSGRDVWLQGTFSIPETNIGIYAQSIPVGSELPLVYGSHITLFWSEPHKRP